MSAVRRYGRDEYEDLDEYEDDCEEQEYEEGDEDGYEEEEVHQPTQEELEYLELRQRLKESIRKSMKKELGTANSGSRDKKNVVRKDNYGSFFGPSQPVIAQRVIQESRSLLENPKLAARISKPNNVNNRSSVSTSATSKPRPSIPKAMNVVKQKVEVLKNTRDYSFLLSEDAELPAQLKSPPPRNIPTRKPEARSAQSLPRSKQVVHECGRDVPNGGDVRKQVHSSNQVRPKVGLEKTATASKLSMKSRKQLGNNNASGPGRPVGSKGVPSKIPIATTVKKVTQPVARNPTAGARKPLPSQQQPGLRKPIQSHLQSGVRRLPPSHSQASVSKNISLQRNMYPGTSKPKVMPRPPSINEVKRPPPNIAGRGVSAHQRSKPKLGKRPYGDSDDEDDPIKAIRKMFGYNRNKYQDDEDDSDMEANFDEILMEEKRSSQIARKEDEEQARLLEEEERRKRLRMAKKRKMGH